MEQPNTKDITTFNWNAPMPKWVVLAFIIQAAINQTALVFISGTDMFPDKTVKNLTLIFTCTNIFFGILAKSLGVKTITNDKN